MEIVRALKALADPSRLRVLAAVAEEELTVGEIQEIVESVQSSPHLPLGLSHRAARAWLHAAQPPFPCLLLNGDCRNAPSVTSLTNRRLPISC